MYDAPQCGRGIETAEETSDGGESGSDKGGVEVFWNYTLK